jgi:hypothetical protein
VVFVCVLDSFTVCSHQRKDGTLGGTKGEQRVNA